MEKRYYILKNKIYDTISFVTLSGNKLEHVAGDGSIPKMVRIEKGDLKTKDQLSTYIAITETEDKTEFELRRDQYLDNMEKYNKCARELAEGK
jgi:hypothetical protein